jgi:hypothetical protein
MTRRERLERKMQQRTQWAQARHQQAEIEWDKADLREERSGIPLGQPILVGHHSEGRHRRAIERADNAMRRAHESHEMAKHHEDRAEGIAWQLKRTIFSDDENAVEALEAKIAKLEADRARGNAINKILRSKPKNERTPEKIAALVAAGLSEETAEKLFDTKLGPVCIPAYVNANIGGRIKQARDRIAQIKRQNAKREAAEASPSGVAIEGTGEYVAVTFAEKPEREIIDALKGAGFYWRGGSWVGLRARLPENVAAYKQKDPYDELAAE